MDVFLFANIDEEHEHSAYVYMLGNTYSHSEIRYGWTVQEAYLQGLLHASNHVIKTLLWHNVQSYNVICPSSLVKNVLMTDYLDGLNSINWRPPIGHPVFHLPLLHELYYHQLYYRERNIGWGYSDECEEDSFFMVEDCRKKLSGLLKHD